MICAFPGNEAFAARLQEELALAALTLEWRRFRDGESYVRFAQDVYGHDGVRVRALDGVSLEIARGDYAQLQWFF